MKPLSVAIIGSFRTHYKAVLESVSLFNKAGLIITTPAGDRVIEPGVQFVRFESNDPKRSDVEIQTEAVYNILRADFVFVVAPEGYIGRTTCYEIGRVIQARKPIYFSEHPLDLPIQVPDSHIQSASLIANKAAAGCFMPVEL